MAFWAVFNNLERHCDLDASSGFVNANERVSEILKIENYVDPNGFVVQKEPRDFSK